MYKHILIATDGSAIASRALSHGLVLAKEAKADVTLLTVTELWSAADMAQRVREGHRDPVGKFEEVVAQSAERILDTAGEQAKKIGVNYQCSHVPDQRPAEGIVATAERSGCDLIVMGSHGRRAVSRLFLGSQAVEVLSHSNIPALIVR
jgi:nucleotide-binding universal stress UspA family protein